MALFKKKESMSKEDAYKNELLDFALEIDKTTGEIQSLPDDTDEEIKKLIHNIKFYVFEYIKRLNEAKVFSKKAVHKFIQEDYPWVNKRNMDKLIGVGMYYNFKNE